ncbi:hypothetical protein GQ42DRAFT_161765 [Ramicandelaber brevisporus]|nr:hypothetical protein GQ42DRAFT_161765 [Ramicandelaber brevisporus]
MFHLFSSLLVRPLLRWLSPPPLASHVGAPCRRRPSSLSSGWLLWLPAPVPPVGVVAMAMFFFSFGLVRFRLVHFGSFAFGSDHLHGYRLAALHGINETLDTLVFPTLCCLADSP